MNFNSRNFIIMVVIRHYISFYFLLYGFIISIVVETRADGDEYVFERDKPKSIDFSKFRRVESREREVT